jgi:hypothetical protein
MTAKSLNLDTSTTIIKEALKELKILKDFPVERARFRHIFPFILPEVALIVAYG